MELEDLLKELKERGVWVDEIISSNKEHPIIYLREFMENREYKILDFLSKKGLLNKNNFKSTQYVEFTITREGVETLSNIDKYLNDLGEKKLSA